MPGQSHQKHGTFGGVWKFSFCKAAMFAGKGANLLWGGILWARFFNGQVAIG
jgi:hypothetical protein